MKYLCTIILLLASLSFGCELLGPSGDVDFYPDRDEYTKGETIVMKIVNNSDSPISFGPCHQPESLIDDGWLTGRDRALQTCKANEIRLDIRESYEFQETSRVFFPADAHRFVLNIVSSGSNHTIASESFRVIQ